jgi:hypothetical protein
MVALQMVIHASIPQNVHTIHVLFPPAIHKHSCAHTSHFATNQTSALLPHAPPFQMAQTHAIMIKGWTAMINYRAPQTVAVHQPAFV